MICFYFKMVVILSLWFGLFSNYMHHSNKMNSLLMIFSILLHVFGIHTVVMSI